MSTYLSEIIAAHRDEAARDRRDLSELVDRALAAPATGGFRKALAGEGGLGVIAEVKRRSPSKGDLAPNLDPAATARSYRAGGARCLSVLTDAAYFGGSPEDLAAAKAATDLPVLRKDFTVSPADVCDARIMGADAILLIVAALDDGELREMSSLADRLGLDVLVEVHDEAELARALDLDATMVGVNQRDLHTFAVDEHRAERLVAAMPDDVVAVAESGIRDAADAQRLAEAGYQGILVGETLVRAADRAAAVAGLAGHRVGPRSGGRRHR
jgi:indole-3-glycerol phosphate synthase